MTDLTISIPDELMEKLWPHLKELPRVLELGLEQIQRTSAEKSLSPRERITHLLAEKGIAHPLDRSLVPATAFNRPRQQPLRIPGKPLSEIIIEQRGPR